MHDVLIAGGGPVGLLLAGELALSGCSVLVLERDDELGSPLKSLPLGLRGLTAGSAEAFYRRGLLATMVNAARADENKAGAEPEAVEAPAPRDVSHFAGLRLDAADIDTSALPARCPPLTRDSDRALRDTTEGWEGRIRCAAGQVRNVLGFRALLIRPDGIVAWADEDTPDRDEFARAAARWFGSPED